MKNNTWLWCAVLLVGCVTQDKLNSNVATRAAFDFNCNKEQITVVDLNGRGTYGANGCGKKAVYVFPSGSLQPVLNSPISAASAR